MKNYVLIITLAAALLGGASVYAQSTPSPSPSISPIMGRDCTNQSQNTELYGFCGGKAAMIQKLAKIPVQLSERRVFVQITQGRSGGEVKLYERQENGTFTVTKWGTPQTFDLLAKIDKSVFYNKGLKCVGKEATAILQKQLGPGKPSDPLAADASPEQAFTESVNNVSGDFVRTTVWILC